MQHETAIAAVPAAIGSSNVPRSRYMKGLAWLGEHHWYALTLLVLSIARIWLGCALPLRAVASSYNTLDDYLSIQYAQLYDHFHPATSEDTLWAVAKSASYSYLLNLLMKLDIPYTLFMSLLWVTAALLTVHAVRGLWMRCAQYDDNSGSAGERGLPTWFFAVSYAVLVFCPTAFDKDVGTRIYRESIMTPLVLLFIGVSLMFIIGGIDAARCALLRPSAREWVWGVILGILWTFYWFVKESGIWLAPSLLVVFACYAILRYRFTVRARRAKRPRDGETAGAGIVDDSAKVRGLRARILASAIVTIMMPLAIFGCGDAAYRAVNMHYFGVPYASVRTEGEIAGFFQRLYSIASDERTDYYWVPWSVMEQAIDASPTLRSQTELLEALRVGAFVEDEDGVWNQGPHHDMAVWTMMRALSDVGLYKNQTDPQKLFRQINQELDAADLPQSTGITFSASLPKKTLGEIWAMRSDWAKVIYASVLWRDYVVADDDYSQMPEDWQQRVRLMELTLNEVLDSPQDPSTSRAWPQRIGLVIARRINVAYQYCAPVLLTLMMASVVMACVAISSRIRRKYAVPHTIWMLLIVGVGCAGSAAALTLAVSWLCSSRTVETFAYYTAPIVPLMMLVEMIAAGIVCEGVIRGIRILRDGSANS